MKDQILSMFDSGETIEKIRTLLINSLAQLTESDLIEIFEHAIKKGDTDIVSLLLNDDILQELSSKCLKHAFFTAVNEEQRGIVDLFLEDTCAAMLPNRVFLLSLRKSLKLKNYPMADLFMQPSIAIRILHAVLEIKKQDMEIVELILKKNILQMIDEEELAIYFGKVCFNKFHHLLSVLLKAGIANLIAENDLYGALYMACITRDEGTLKQLCQEPTIIKLLIEKWLLSLLKDDSFDSIHKEVCRALLLKHLKIYGINLSNILQGNFVDEAAQYLTHPTDFLAARGFPSSTLQAVSILKTNFDLLEYESSLRGWQDPEDEKRIGRTLQHFETNIHPAFEAKFLTYGEGDESKAIVSIERNIRALLLNRMRTDLRQRIEQEPQVLIIADTSLVFINTHFDQLICGNDKNLMSQARGIFNSNSDNNHIAWRAYDPWAPHDPNWPNLLTSALNEAENQHELYSLDVIQKTKMNRETASQLLRIRTAYFFTYLFELQEQQTVNQKWISLIIENAVGHLADIRRAHNSDLFSIDSPSCLPVALHRVSLMYEGTPFELRKDLKEILTEVLTPHLIDVFQKSLTQCGDDSARNHLFDAMIGLNDKNAEQIISDPSQFSHAQLRADFLQCFGSVQTVAKFVNEQLILMKRDPLTEIECQIYVSWFIANIDNWGHEPLLNTYQQFIQKIENPFALSSQDSAFLLQYNEHGHNLVETANRNATAWEMIMQVLVEYRSTLNLPISLMTMANIVAKIVQTSCWDPIFSSWELPKDIASHLAPIHSDPDWVRTVSKQLDLVINRPYRSALISLLRQRTADHPALLDGDHHPIKKFKCCISELN